MRELNVSYCLATLTGHEGSFKNGKNAFWMIQRAKKIDFWPFSGLNLVGSTWYWELWYHFMFFNIGHRYQFMGNRSKDTKLHFEWPKGPSLRFLTGSLSLVRWTVLILHVAIVLNVLRHLATYQVFDWFKLFLGLTLSPLFTALQLVSPSVSLYGKVTENRAKDFLTFLHKCSLL